eukprot:6186279-Pleurochrysis_carterae.AAC.1
MRCRCSLLTVLNGARYGRARRRRLIHVYDLPPLPRWDDAFLLLSKARRKDSKQNTPDAVLTKSSLGPSVGWMKGSFTFEESNRRVVVKPPAARASE